MTSDPVVTSTSLLESSPVSRSLESVSTPLGFILEGQKVTTLSSGQPFSLSAGRALYTGNTRANISYSTGGLSTTKELEKFHRYVFPVSLSGSVTSGKAYVLTPSGTEKLSYSDSMKGMPLLPDTRILSPNGEVAIYSPREDQSLILTAGTEYRYISLGRPKDRYNVSFSYPNGFYSARLRSLTDEQ